MPLYLRCLLLRNKMFGLTPALSIIHSVRRLVLTKLFFTFSSSSADLTVQQLLMGIQSVGLLQSPLFSLQVSMCVFIKMMYRLETLHVKRSLTFSKFSNTYFAFQDNHLLLCHVFETRELVLQVLNDQIMTPLFFNFF